MRLRIKGGNTKIMFFSNITGMGKVKSILALYQNLGGNLFYTKCNGEKTAFLRLKKRVRLPLKALFSFHTKHNFPFLQSGGTPQKS